MEKTKVDTIKKALEMKCPNCKKKMVIICKSCGYDDRSRFKGQPPENVFVG